MTSVVAIGLCTVFLLLGLWHFYMAFARGGGEGAAVPSVDGKPLFVPSTAATVAVGVLLLLCAALVAGTSRLLPVGLPPRPLSWLSYALGLALFARAVGEFKYVGFFKSVRGSQFAKMDTLVYSPLGLVLSAGGGFVAINNAA
jgi:hypothetical protein